MQLSRLRLTVLAIAAALVPLYLLAGFWGVPQLLRWQLQKFATQTLQRQLTLGSVQFNPFTFELRASDVALLDNDGSTLLGFRQLYIDAEPAASLWQRRINIKQVQLDGPDIKVAIDARGQLNLAHVLPPSAAADQHSDTSLPSIHIGLLSVTQGHIAYSDLSKGSAYKAVIQPLELSLKEFQTDADYKNAYSFSARTAQGEQLETSGEFVLQPLSVSGRFGLKQLQVAPIAAYLAASQAFVVQDGLLALDGQYSFLATGKAPDWQLTLSKITGKKLSIADKNTVATPAIVIPGIEVVQTRVSSADRNVSVQSVKLDAPMIDMRRDSAGVLNLQRLFAGNDTRAPVGAVPSTVETTAPVNNQSQQSPQDPPWQVKISQTNIESGTVNFTDDTVTPTAHFALQPVALQIANLGTGNDNMPLSGDVVIDSAGHLKLDGDLKLSPLQAGMNVAVDGFAVTSLQPYLNKLNQLSLKSGVFALQGRVDYAPMQLSADEPAAAAASAGKTALSFTGAIGVENLHSADKRTGIEFVDWKQVDVKGIKLAADVENGKLLSLEIDTIIAEEGYANVQIAKDRTINAAQILSAPGAQSSAAAPAAGKRAVADSPKIRVASIKIIESAADFGDRSIEPNFASGIVHLNGTIDGVSSQPASRATVALHGIVDRYAPVDVVGEINPLAARSYSDMSVKFSNMELTTFNPYSGKFAGYNITKGKLSADFHYQVVDGKLDAQHHVEIDSLEFGNQTDSKDAAPIPLKLAVALLKDSRGMIVVDLPVSGSLDDPEFSLAPVVWKAFLNLLGDVAKAPFTALARLFGGSSDELAFVEFQPGLAELNATEAAKLTTLAKALVERPQLKLNIPLNTTTAADPDAMAQQALLALAPVINDAATRAAYLVKLEMEYMNRSGKAMVYAAGEPNAAAPDAAVPAADEVMNKKIAALEQALLPLLKPDADALADLGRRRANAVQALLLSNRALPVERVFLINDEPSAANKQTRSNSAAPAKMEMHLE